MTPATDPGRAAEEMRDPTKLPLPGGYYLCQLQPDHRTCSLHMPDGLHIGNMLSEHAADFADVLVAAEEEAAQLRARLHEAQKGREGSGRDPGGSGSQASPEVPSDLRRPGFDPSRMQWQSIATAPRDDEESILVCDARVVGGFHQVVWWDADSKQPEYRWDTSDGPKFHRDAFTHWMPLPVPPALGIEARRAETLGSACESPAPTGAMPDPLTPAPEATQEAGDGL